MPGEVIVSKVVDTPKDIKLQLKGGELKELKIEYAMNWMLLKSIIDDITDEEQFNEPIVVAEVEEEHWPYLYDFFVLNEKSPLTQLPPQPLQSTILTDYLPQEYVDYIDTKSLELVYEIMWDANFLDLKNLTHLWAIRIAKDMKGKDIDEIRKMFGIEMDFTAEELAAIKAEEDEMTAVTDI